MAVFIDFDFDSINNGVASFPPIKRQSWKIYRIIRMTAT